MDKNKVKKRISTFLKGMAMGSVDIVPGMSGGSMALILKIYRKTIKEIKSLDYNFFKNILGFKFQKAFEKTDWAFLLSLFLGIITAVFSLAKIIDWSLSNYPVYLYSLFFGLIIVSALLLMPKKKIRAKDLAFLLLGFILAWTISVLSPASTPDTYGFVFLSGAIAICAMILPGISGAFILLLLGKYAFMISVLKDPLSSNNFLFIMVFILGCLVGLLLFARILNYFISKYYQASLTLLIGFMLGALNKIWPFKEGLETKIIDNQEIITREKNFMPNLSNELLPLSLLMFSIGILLAYSLSRIKREK
jgi:putative membrane protein